MKVGEYEQYYNTLNLFAFGKIYEIFTFLIFMQHKFW